MNNYESLRYLQRNPRVVVVSICLFAVLVVTSLPTVFYLWDPPTNHNKLSYSSLCNDSNKQSVNWKSLNASPCSDHFDWSQTRNISATRNISVLKCDFQETDEALGKVEALIELFGSFDSEAEKCKTYATPILCHYIYQDCEAQPKAPTEKDCMKVRDVYCKDLWFMAVDYLQGSTLGKCVGIPDCSRDFSNSSNSTLFKSSGQNITVRQQQNQSEVLCTPPLVRTELRDIPTYLECSPRCFQEDWISETDQTAMETMIYLTAVVSLFSVVITFITWAKVAELRQFPQSTLLYIVIGYTIALVGFTLPLVVGRRNAYCSHEDVLSMFADPSVICKIQGVLVQFGVLSALIWWLCSIFNVFVSVYIVSNVNPIRKYSKQVFMVEALASVVVPAGLVAVVLGMEGKYTMFSRLVITCGPPTVKLIYFTMAFPVQLAVLVGVIMTALIMLKLEKSKGRRKSMTSKTGAGPTFKRTLSTSSASAAQTTIQIRFLMIIIVFPLTIGVIMSTIVIYDKLSDEVLDDFVEYVSCIQTKTAPEICEGFYNSYSGVSIGIIDLIMFDVLSVVIFAYVLAPRLARQFWADWLWSVHRRVVNLVTNNKEDTDRNDCPEVGATSSTPDSAIAPNTMSTRDKNTIDKQTESKL